MPQAAPGADAIPLASPSVTPAAPRCAADIMTRNVIHVGPGTTVGAVARLLVAHRISAVPVLNADGVPLGMVSESDLLGRTEDDRLAGREWWLALLTEPGEAATAATRKVEEVMHAPALTVGADAPLAEVAELLRAHAIQRLPVMRDGRVVGIVSRADLMRLVAGIRLPAAAPARNGGLAQFIMNLVGDPAHLVRAPGTAPTFSHPDAPTAAVATNLRDQKGCLLIDAFLPGMSGMALLRILRETGDALPVIIITGRSDVPMAVEAMKAGALDFIENAVTGQDLLAAVDRALELGQDAGKTTAGREVAAAHVPGLTTRQRQILELVLAGHPSKNIAAALGISQRTVENHRAEIMKRTGAKSLPALVRLALGAATPKKTAARPEPAGGGRSTGMAR